MENGTFGSSNREKNLQETDPRDNEQGERNQKLILLTAEARQWTSRQSQIDHSITREPTHHHLLGGMRTTYIYNNTSSVQRT